MADRRLLNVNALYVNARHCRQIHGGETVADGTMFGSDWLMLNKEPGWDAYASRIADIARRRFSATTS